MVAERELSREPMGCVSQEMVDRQLSASCVVAYALWGLCLGLWAVSWLIGQEQIGRLSIITCGAAATATVRTYCLLVLERVKNALVVTREVTGHSVVKPMR